MRVLLPALIQGTVVQATYVPFLCFFLIHQLRSQLRAGPLVLPDR